MYNWIEYSDNSGSLWQNFKDGPGCWCYQNFHVDNNNSALFKFKQKITGKTAANGRKDVEIAVPLKYLNNFWRILEMPLINCEIIHILTWSDKFVLSNDAKAVTFAITDT